jgi:pimeloyl-ACP methyl ester carboxylesterase
VRPNPSCGLKILFPGIAALLSMLASWQGLAQSSRFRCLCIVFGAILLLDGDLPLAQAQPAPAPLGFQHATATVDGVTIHYVIGGKGPGVVVLHGWPVTAYAWRGVGPELAKRFTVIAPDMPGFGDSGPSLKGYQKRIIADEISGLVHHLGFDSIMLAGHDMGGPVAVSYAAAHPAEVRRLALIETMMPGFGLEDLKASAAWHMGFAQVRDLPETLVAGRERDFLKYFYRRGILRDGALTELDLAEYVRAYSLPGRMSASFEYYRALNADVPAFKELAKAKLAMPVIAIGAGRGIGANADGFRQFAANVTEVTIPDSGHHLPDDNPEALAGILVDFFAGPP